MHDSLITKNFVVFPYLPLFFDGQKCAEGKSPYQFDNGCNAYYGVLPKSADSAGKNNENIRWFKIPGAHQVFHFVNAWEETDADGKAVIVAYGCAFHQNFNLDLGLELGGSKKGKDQEQEAAGAGASKTTREDDKPPKGKPTPFVPQLTKFVFNLDNIAVKNAPTPKVAKTCDAKFTNDNFLSCMKEVCIFLMQSLGVYRIACITSATLAVVFCNAIFRYSRLDICDANRCKRASVSLGKVCNTNAPKFGGGGTFHLNRQSRR